MAIQEALSLVVNKFKRSQANDKQEYIENSYTAAGLKYLFDCYDRIEEEKRQYPKVKNIFSNLIISTNLTTSFTIYREVVLLKFLKY